MSGEVTLRHMSGEVTPRHMTGEVTPRHISVEIYTLLTYPDTGFTSTVLPLPKNDFKENPFFLD